MTTFFPLYMIHLEWWNHHLFPLYYPRGMMEWPPFSHCIYIRSTWSDYLFLLYMVHVGWPPFPIVYGPRGMTTFSHCIWSTWDDHLFLLYMVHVGWPPFPIVYGPRGMTTFSHCIWSTWDDHLFLLYMVHVEWPPFPIVYGPRGMTTFSYCIWSTWDDHLFPFYMFHVVDYFVVFLSSPGTYSDAVRAYSESFFVISSVVGTVLCILQQWRSKITERFTIITWNGSFNRSI